MTKEELFPRSRYPKRKRTKFLLPNKHLLVFIEVYGEKTVNRPVRQTKGEYIELRSGDGESSFISAKETSATGQLTYYLSVSGTFFKVDALQFALILEEFLAGIMERHRVKLNDDESEALLDDMIERAEWEEF